MTTATEDRLPLLLETCPPEILPAIVFDALADLTLYERMKLGPDLAKVVGLRAEAKASGYSLELLDAELDEDDVATLARIVEPHLEHDYESPPDGPNRHLN